MKTAGKKKAAVKKKVVEAHHEEPVKSVTVPSVPPVTVYREAFLAQIYDLKRWAQKGMASEGMVSSAMPRLAKLAASLTSGARCHFCGAKQEPLSKDAVMNLHPEYPVCECLIRYVPRAHDYIEGWSTKENLQKLSQDFLEGKIKGDTLVYQTLCKGCGDICLFNVEKVFSEFQRHGNVWKRKTCVRCHWRWQMDKVKREAAIKQPLTVSIAEATTPAAGPAATLKKNESRKKFNKGKPRESGETVLPALPPLSALLPSAEKSPEQAILTKAPAAPISEPR